MTFLQVKYFVAVCECGYVTKAAEQLYVSQPSVSRAIRELEEEYHVELFRREKQRMILTNRGEYLWKESKKLMEQWRRLEKQMAESGKRSLTVGMSAVLAQAFQKEISERFARENPGIELYIQTMGSGKAISMVEQGELVAALVLSDGEEGNTIKRKVLGELEGRAFRERFGLKLCLVYGENMTAREEVKRFVDFCGQAGGGIA